MPIVIDNVLNEIRSIAASGNDRVAKAKRLAERIQVLGQYRWVGIYDVGAEFVSIISWSGPSAPEYPEFPLSKGLTASAIEQKKTVHALNTFFCHLTDGLCLPDLENSPFSMILTAGNS